MKKFLIAMAVLLVILVGGAFALPSLVPSSVYKENIESTLSRELARPVNVSGDVKVSAFPSLRAKTGRVEISNPDGFEDGLFVAMDGLEARVKLIPLLSKRVEITSFILENPEINLIINKEGRANWENPTLKADETVKKSEGPFKRDGRYGDIDPSIGKFKLSNGQIAYRDDQSGQSHNLKNVNLDLSLPNLRAPIAVAGDVIYNDIPAKIDVSLDSIRSFLDGEETPLSLALKTDFADISTKGRFLQSEDFAFDLDVDGEIIDVAELTSLSPIDLPYVSIAQSGKIKGNYRFDGKVLSAKSANIDIVGDEFTAGYKGDVTLAEKPVFSGQARFSSSDISRLADTFEFDHPGIKLLKTVALTTDLSAIEGGFSAKNLSAELSGDDFRTSFSGSAVSTDIITANGDFDGSGKNLTAMLDTLGIDVPQIALLGEAQATGKLSYDGQDISLSSITASARNGAVNGSYTGSVSMADTIEASGRFDVDIPSVTDAGKLAQYSLPQLSALGNLAASGDISLRGNEISITGLQAVSRGGAAAGNFNGSVELAEQLNADGQFDFDIASVPTLAKIVMPDNNQAKALGNLSAAGRLSMRGKTVSISSLMASSSGGALSGQFSGDVNMAENLGLSGQFKAQVPSIKAASDVAEIKVPYSDSIGRLDVEGSISGQGQSLSLTGLIANLTEGQLNGQYSGRADFKNGFSLDGNLSSEIRSLRNLAQQAGVQLPPSTSEGEIYEAVAINGQVKGNPENIDFTNAKLVFDDINGSGNFNINRKGNKPYLTGLLTLDGLNLRPYTAAYSAQNPTGKIQPWSEAPLNLSALRLIDSDVKISTPNILTDRLSFGQSNIEAKIRNGVLTAKMPDASLYGGRGDITATLDGSSDVTRVNLDMGLSQVQSNSFLSALAGITSASGDIGSALSVKGSGRSQAEIMRSLNGLGDFKMLDGQIRGFDVSGMLSNLPPDPISAARQIPPNIGPNKQTKFNDFVGFLKIENGVVRLNKVSLNALNAQILAEGKIDLGTQDIDIRLRPRSTDPNVSGFAKDYGIPLKYAGGFGSAALSLDDAIFTEFLAAKARKELTKNLGGTAGDIIGGLIGGTPTTPQQPPQQEPDTQGTVPSQKPPEQTQPEPAQSDPTPEDIVSDLFGGILGGQPQDTPPEENKTDPAEPKEDAREEPKEEEEPTLEDSLLDIFGVKPKPDDAR